MWDDSFCDAWVITGDQSVLYHTSLSTTRLGWHVYLLTIST